MKDGFVIAKHRRYGENAAMIESMIIKLQSGTVGIVEISEQQALLYALALLKRGILVKFKPMIYTTPLKGIYGWHGELYGWEGGEKKISGYEFKKIIVK
jgi:hypothetical protein